MSKLSKGKWIKRAGITFFIVLLIAVAAVTAAYFCGRNAEGGEACGFCELIGLGFSRMGSLALITAGSVLVVFKVIPAKMIFHGLFKLAVISGVTAKLTGWIGGRKERELNGENIYRLKDDYVLVVGFDFQTKALINRLLSEERACVLLITDRDVRSIRTDVFTGYDKSARKRVKFMRRNLAAENTYSSLRICGARAIYLMGDEGVAGRDAITLRASELISDKAVREYEEANKAETVETAPIKAYMQFADPGFYSQMRSLEMPMDRCKDSKGNALFDLEIFNYYDSWVWKCWSEKDSTDDGEPYRPLKFKPDAECVELFVVGSGKALKAVVDSAITLMNYGCDSKQNRLTVVSDRAYEVLPSADVISELPELEVIEYSMCDFNRLVVPRMVTAAENETTALTVVIIEDDPEVAVKRYLELPYTLKCNDVSILVWMQTLTANVPKKDFIRVIKQPKDEPRQILTRLFYFGMIDCMPWMKWNRHTTGAEVNYYYEASVPDGSPHGDLIKENGSAFVQKAIDYWDATKSVKYWNGTARWAKWASVNSAESFKEKASIIEGKILTDELFERLLKAEHNRWWSEKLLGGWRTGAKDVKDKVRRLHEDMIPFEKLSQKVKNIDKINIAAMARQGYIKTDEEKDIGGDKS